MFALRATWSLIADIGLSDLRWMNRGGCLGARRLDHSRSRGGLIRSTVKGSLCQALQSCRVTCSVSSNARVIDDESVDVVVGDYVRHNFLVFLSSLTRASTVLLRARR